MITPRSLEPPPLPEPASPDEAERLVLLITAGAAMLAGLWWLGGCPALARCAWAQITGWPCPGCGTTRALQALMAGDFSMALHWNPAVVAGLAAWGALTLYSLLVVAGMMRPWRPVVTSPVRRLLWGGLGLLLGLNWLHLLLGPHG